MSLYIICQEWRAFRLGISIYYVSGINHEDLPFGKTQGMPSELNIYVHLAWLTIGITIEGTIPPAK